MCDLSRRLPSERHFVELERDASMTEDQRLEAALARLTAALASLEAVAGRACRPGPPQEPARSDQDHDDLGSNRSKVMNVIDFNELERDAGGKPVSTFPHPALDGELDRAVAKAERLTAASEEVSRVLRVAIEALSAMVSRSEGSTED
jgi:hypothetical protein